MTTSVKDRLKALNSAIQKKSGGGDQSWKLFFPFWKAANETTSIVRFLPDINIDNNSMQFLVENLQHELNVNGERKKVGCLSMYGEKCPICEVSRSYYDTAKASDSEAEKLKNEAIGKKYYRKKSYIGQIIVIDTTIEHDQSQLVKLIDFGPAVFTQIQAAFKSGDLEAPPYEYKGGYNFRIKKTMNGQFASYATSSFAPKASDLDDEIVDKLELYNLADYRAKKLDLAVVEAYLLADQTGQHVPEDEETAPQQEAAKPAVILPVKVLVEAASSPEAPSKTKSVIEQLKARAAAQAKAAEIAE